MSVSTKALTLHAVEIYRSGQLYDVLHRIDKQGGILMTVMRRITGQPISQLDGFDVTYLCDEELEFELWT